VIKIYTLIVASALLIGCGTVAPGPEIGLTATPAGASGASGQTAIKRYPMHGKIVSVSASEKSARIDAGPIGDWMGAMTMNYPIKDDTELAKVSAGQTIDATVFVNGDDFWVGEIKPGK